MILKLLLVVGVISIVYFMFIKKKPTHTPSMKKKKDELKTNDMVECVECGVYIEVSEAILSNAHYYCSRECISKVS